MKTTITLLFALVLYCLPATAQVLQQDSLALVAFYNSTGGPNWTNNTGWLTGPVGTWHGVTVESNRVIKLIMYSNNLQGELPTEICNLYEMTDLALGHDLGLTGTIPVEIHQLSHLEGLFIGYCTLLGTIPNEIGYCENLKFIQLMENNLVGNIPSDLGNLDSLQFLDLHNNQLTGTIPPELGNCSNLWKLLLNDNQLYGTIPMEVSYLNNLQTLDVSHNQLSGELPEYLSNLFFQSSVFIGLYFSGNQFSGPVPEAWGNISFLIDELDLSDNQLISLPNVNYNWLMTSFHIENNKLTFEHIESHYQSYLQGLYYFFYYYPQENMLEYIDTALVPGCSFDIYSGTGGEYTNYKWFRNGELILESPDAETLHLTEISFSDTGIYTCTASNSLIYFLYLYRQPVHIGIDTGTYVVNYSINEGIAIFPNPASDRITIEKPCDAETFYLKVSDIHGKNTIKQNFKQHKEPNINLDIEDMEQGIYLLQLQTEEKNYIAKFIKNKQGIHR